MKRAIGGVLIAAVATSAGAQEALLPRFGLGVTPSYTLWTFDAPLGGTSGVSRVAQLAVPVRTRAELGRWTVEADAAFAVGTVTLESDDGGTTDESLNGLTDLRIRASAPIRGDGLQFTLGLNVPVGTTGLDAEQTRVLQTVGAPGLRLPVAAYGLGPGATVGVIAAREVGAWALAAGASFEERTEYTPLELAVTGGTAATTVDPGYAAHLTLGADRVVGGGRLALLVVGDVFTEDAVAVGVTADSTVTTAYTVGPQVTALASLDLGWVSWRSANLSLAARQRFPFRNAAGETVDGSDATYVDAAFSGVRGRPGGRGWIVGLDARWDSGISSTTTLVGAAVTAGGLTLGAELPMGALAVRIAARGQYGTFDTGVVRRTGTGVSLSVGVGSRAEVR